MSHRRMASKSENKKKTRRKEAQPTERETGRPSRKWNKKHKKRTTWPIAFCGTGCKNATCQLILTARKTKHWGLLCFSSKWVFKQPFPVSWHGSLEYSAIIQILSWLPIVFLPLKLHFCHICLSGSYFLIADSCIGFYPLLLLWCECNAGLYLLFFHNY